MNFRSIVESAFQFCFYCETLVKRAMRFEKMELEKVPLGIKKDTIDENKRKQEQKQKKKVKAEGDIEKPKKKLKLTRRENNHFFEFPIKNRNTKGLWLSQKLN